MIRTYSDPLIVLEVHTGGERLPVTVILAEAKEGNADTTLEIRFFGQTAHRVAEKAVAGMKFTYRGYVDFEDGNQILVGLTFTPIV